MKRRDTLIPAPHSTGKMQTSAFTFLLPTLGLFFLPTGSANAFCGFYVTGAESTLYNNATQVVLMRSDDRTILSMQNNYEGPPEDFAMVIPVPEVLQEENVKTLDPSIFDKIDTLSAPRLVEYWEQDPCTVRTEEYEDATSGSEDDDDDESGVTVEAEFVVGEYHIVILSAEDSTSLDTWLDANEYNTPEGAESYYDEYITQGYYFFVAEVDSQAITYSEDLAVLSPLRIAYSSTTFNLPIRLGLINSSGTQDLLVYTLGQSTRYEAANYSNTTIPTNIEVVDDVRNDFGTFYEALYSATLEAYPGAVVTEYSWDASSCDPCPGPVLEEQDYLTLGADVLPNTPTWGWVLTRLHARYTQDTIGEDLIFSMADPITGGREVYDENGELETTATSSSINNFQGRYIIRHPWEGEVSCEDPNYGVWGGPPDGESSEVTAATSPNTNGEALDPSKGQTTDLSALVAEDIPELGIETQNEDQDVSENDETLIPPSYGVTGSGGCNCSTSSKDKSFMGVGIFLAGLSVVLRKRKLKSARSGR